MESANTSNQSSSDRPRRYLPLFSQQKGNAGLPEGDDQALYKIRLGTRQVKTIMGFVQHHQLGMPSFITAIWSVLLSHYSNQYALPVLYSVVSDKEGKECRLDYPLLIHIQKEDHLLSLIQRIQMEWNKQHSSDELREDFSQQTKVDPPSGAGKDFFNVCIAEIYGDFPSPSLNAEKSPPLYGIDQPEIALCYRYDPDILECAIQYDGGRFGKMQIARFAGHFKTLLANALLLPEKTVLFHPMLTTRERRQMQQWNDTEQAYPLDKTVVQLIEEQASRTPDAIALEFGEQKLTYYELNHRANQISRMILESYSIQGHGVLPTGTLIAIVLDRSADVIPSMFGVMKAGAAIFRSIPNILGNGCDLF